MTNLLSICQVYLVAKKTSESYYGYIDKKENTIISWMCDSVSVLVWISYKVCHYIKTQVLYTPYCSLINHHINANFDKL